MLTHFYYTWPMDLLNRKMDVGKSKENADLLIKIKEVTFVEREDKHRP
jgi:hypothetical protein